MARIFTEGFEDGDWGSFEGKFEPDDSFKEFEEKLRNMKAEEQEGLINRVRKENENLVNKQKFIQTLINAIETERFEE